MVCVFVIMSCYYLMFLCRFDVEDLRDSEGVSLYCGLSVGEPDIFILMCLCSWCIYILTMSVVSSVYCGLSDCEHILRVEWSVVIYLCSNFSHTISFLGSLSAWYLCDLQAVLLVWFQFLWKLLCMGQLAWILCAMGLLCCIRRCFVCSIPLWQLATCWFFILWFLVRSNSYFCIWACKYSKVFYSKLVFLDSFIFVLRN